MAIAARAAGIPVQRKTTPYLLMVVEEIPISSNNGIVTEETLPRVVTFPCDHQERIKFNITPMKQELILRMSWLEKHNQSIDWVDKSIGRSRT